jgi:hypothetical protein
VRRTRTSKALAARSAELAFAVPQVIAHRALRSDRKELHLMGAEKVMAFGESWNAMMMQSVLEYQRVAISLAMSFWFPWASRRSPFSSVMPAILGAGLAPIHRRARANVRRLGKRRARK